MGLRGVGWGSVLYDSWCFTSTEATQGVICGGVGLCGVVVWGSVLCEMSIRVG